MALKNYNVPRHIVTDAMGNELADVRGLNFKDLNILIQRNFENLDRLMALWDHYQELAASENRSAEQGAAQLGGFFAEIAASAPAIVVDVIALGADAMEDEDIDSISKWPMHAQVSAIARIYQLSIIDFGGPSKMLGVVMNLLRQHAPAVTTLLA